MKLLLDTHAFLWHAGGSPQMSAMAVALLADPANDLLLSMATLWEIAIKAELGKLALSSSYADCMTKAITGYGLTILPSTPENRAHYAAMPFSLLDHRDPCDRLIITHAQRNGASMVGDDIKSDAHGARRLW